MTDRMRRRLSKMDERLSIALKKRKQEDQEYISNVLFHARHHATAVAAIVLSGQPKIDEPLNMAWKRALQHYGIKFDAWDRLADQRRAAEQLRPVIMEGKEQSARFTEIFAAAPVWLLQFTGVAMDARLLKFEVPRLASGLSWGDAGYQEARRWPLLPSGVMTAGDPIPNIDSRRVWLALFCMLTVGDPIQAFNGRLSVEEEETFCSTGNPLLDRMNLALPFVLKGEAHPDREWLPHEKRQMRRIVERITRLTKRLPKRKSSRRSLQSPLRANLARPKANRRKVRQRTE
jgi:hypothetical protein